MCELKLKAAVLLLNLQTAMLLEGNKDPSQLLARFEDKTENEPELFDAGMYVAAMLAAGDV